MEANPKEKMEAAQHYLADTDREYADLATDLTRAKIFCKLVRARAYAEAEGTDGQKKAAAEMHPDTIKADMEMIEIRRKYEHMKVTRESARSDIDIARSINANQRRW